MKRGSSIDILEWRCLVHLTIYLILSPPSTPPIPSLVFFLPYIFLLSYQIVYIVYGTTSFQRVKHDGRFHHCHHISWKHAD